MVYQSLHLVHSKPCWWHHRICIKSSASSMQLKQPPGQLIEQQSSILVERRYQWIG